MSDYFERRAERYSERSASGLWRHFRRREFAAVVDLLSPKAGESLLELGCGSGFYAVPLQEEFGMKVVGVDASAGMLEALKTRCPSVETYRSALETFRTPKRFDKVLAAGVFEFVRNAESAAVLCKDALTEGGLLVVLAPVAGGIGALYKWSHQLRGCPTFIRSEAEYERLFARSGFSLVEVKQCTSLSFAMSLRRTAGAPTGGM